MRLFPFWMLRNHPAKRGSQSLTGCFAMTPYFYCHCESVKRTKQSLAYGNIVVLDCFAFARKSNNLFYAGNNKSNTFGAYCLTASELMPFSLQMAA